MFVAQFVNNCGFNQWSVNSQVVHAVAVKDVTVPVWAHNPAVVRGPSGEWVLTYCANATVNMSEATCSNGTVTKNSTFPTYPPPLEKNFMSIANSPDGPWSDPIQIDAPFDKAVPPFQAKGQPNRNTNLVMSIAPDGTMKGLWRRCCSPPPKYAPPGGEGASVIFSVHASDWKNLSTWKANSTGNDGKLDDLP
jgi:hypothetical protein